MFLFKFSFPINSQMLLLLSTVIIYIPLYAYQFQILNLVVVVIYSITLSSGYLCSLLILLSPLYLSKSNNIMNRKQIILIVPAQLIVALIHRGKAALFILQCFSSSNANFDVCLHDQSAASDTSTVCISLSWAISHQFMYLEYLP